MLKYKGWSRRTERNQIRWRPVLYKDITEGCRIHTVRQTNGPDGLSFVR